MTPAGPTASSGTGVSAGLGERIAYRTRYFDDPYALVEQIIAKTVVPYQI